MRVAENDEVLIFCYLSLHHGYVTGFLQVRENWKKSGNLSGQGKVRKILLGKSRKMKN